MSIFGGAARIRVLAYSCAALVLVNKAGNGTKVSLTLLELDLGKKIV